MVSKASEDLPEPERPVNTTSRSRGIATSIFLRLCSRAPRIVIWRASRTALLERSAIGSAALRNGGSGQSHPPARQKDAGPFGLAGWNVVRTTTLCQPRPGIAVENLCGKD